MSFSRTTQRLLLATAALFGLATAQAEEVNSSLTLSGIVISQESSASATAIVGYEFYFFGHHLGLSPRFQITYSEHDEGDETVSSSSTGYGLGADFYFREVGGDGTVIPFIGAGFDLRSTTTEDSDESTDFLAIYGEAGVKFFLSERASFDAKVQYKSLQYDEELLQDTAPDSEIDFIVGLSVYF